VPTARDDLGAACPALDAIDAALDSVAALGRPRRMLPLPGGLTNHNYQVTTPRGRYVARFPSASSALLEIDRVAEHRNARLAAAAGAGPRVVAYRPGLLVIDWVDGRTLEPADLTTSEVLQRVAAACRRLHAGPRFVGDFDMFAVQRRYLRLVEERGFRLPVGYRDYLPRVADIQAALAAHPQGTVPCHNDLLTSNLIDDGNRVWIIDYEYAGNNERAFELGNMWSEAGLPVESLGDIVRCYDGRPTLAAIARARLYGLMSKYGWTLWASIQDAQSDIEFDFWSWGMEKYDRAVAEFEGPDLGRLLADVAN
jgi:thiamine kinase-like enzyme